MCSVSKNLKSKHFSKFSETLTTFDGILKVPYSTIIDYGKHISLFANLKYFKTLFWQHFEGFPNTQNKFLLLFCNNLDIKNVYVCL